MMNSTIIAAGASATSMLVAPVASSAGNAIASGAGFGTYYYDLESPSACSTDFSSINGGIVECNNAALTLQQIGSNNLVAMNHSLLASDPAKYCGKQVIVSVNGQPSATPFFIGDGCERCGTGSSNDVVWNPAGAPGLDFSFTALSQLNDQACTAGHIDITWQITDTTLYNFDSNAPGKPNGAVKRHRSSLEKRRRRRQA